MVKLRYVALVLLQLADSHIVYELIKRHTNSLYSPQPISIADDSIDFDTRCSTAQDHSGVEKCLERIAEEHIVLKRGGEIFWPR